MLVVEVRQTVIVWKVCIMMLSASNDPTHLMLVRLRPAVLALRKDRYRGREILTSEQSCLDSRLREAVSFTREIFTPWTVRYQLILQLFSGEH